MMKKLGLFFVSLIAALVIVGVNLKPALAFNQNNLMDDVVFNKSSSMTAADIDFWLNNYFGSASCISTSHGFASVDVTGYNPTNGFLYGSSPVSAGTVIYDAAQAYGINPQVLLTTLQKEQSLITGGSGCSTLQYAAAMGYGCPDGGTTHSYPAEGTPPSALYYLNGSAVTSVSGTCVSSRLQVGFSEQVIHAAWLLEFGLHRSEGNTAWAVVNGNWNNSDDPCTTYNGFMTQGTWARINNTCAGYSTAYYDGYATIDSTSVYMTNGATAALYWYTPHFAGNQNFDTIYQGWFGSLYATYSGDPVWQSVYTDNTKSIQLGWNASLTPVQSAWVVIVMKNTGDVTWTKNGGGADVRMVTANTWGHQSVFCNGNSNWIATNPICTRPAVFDEASVAPGATGTFEFRVDAPSVSGVYNESFGLIIDGQQILGGGTALVQFNVQPPAYAAQPVWQSVYTDAAHTNSLGWNATVAPTQPAYVIVTMKNTGNIVWTKNGGSNDVRLVTYNTWGHQSVFCNGNSNWIATNPICTRPAVFDEANVPPGSNGTFEFRLDPPPTPGSYTEFYSLIIDGKALFSSGVAAINLNVGYTYNAQPVWQAVYTDSSKTTQEGWNGSIASLGNSWVVIVMKNTSNFTWTKNGGSNDVRLVTYNTWGHQSVFCNGNSNWIATNPICTRPAVFDEANVPPGSNGTFEFRVDAPQATGSYNEAYGLIVDGRSTFNSGVAVVGFTVH